MKLHVSSGKEEKIGMADEIGKGKRRERPANISGSCCASLTHTCSVSHQYLFTARGGTSPGLQHLSLFLSRSDFNL